MRDEFLSPLARIIDGEQLYYNTTLPVSIISWDDDKTGGEDCIVTKVSDNKIVFSGEIDRYAADEDTKTPECNKIGIKITPKVTVSKYHDVKVSVNGTPAALDEGVFKFTPSLNDIAIWKWTINIKWNDEFTEVFKVEVTPSAKLKTEVKAADSEGTEEVGS